MDRYSNSRQTWSSKPCFPAYARPSQSNRSYESSEQLPERQYYSPNRHAFDRKILSPNAHKKDFINSYEQQHSHKNDFTSSYKQQHFQSNSMLPESRSNIDDYRYERDNYHMSSNIYRREDSNYEKVNDFPVKKVNPDLEQRIGYSDQDYRDKYFNERVQNSSILSTDTLYLQNNSISSHDMYQEKEINSSNFSDKHDFSEKIDVAFSSSRAERLHQSFDNAPKNENILETVNEIKALQDLLNLSKELSLVHEMRSNDSLNKNVTKGCIKGDDVTDKKQLSCKSSYDMFYSDDSKYNSVDESFSSSSKSTISAPEAESCIPKSFVPSTSHIDKSLYPSLVQSQTRTQSPESKGRVTKPLVPSNSGKNLLYPPIVQSSLGNLTSESSFDQPKNYPSDQYLDDSPYSPNSNVFEESEPKISKQAQNINLPSLKYSSSKLTQISSSDSSKYNCIPFLSENLDVRIDSLEVKHGASKVIKEENLSTIFSESNSGFKKEEESAQRKSYLEDAIDVLIKEEPIVGLDYIVEYTNLVSMKGSLPFYCKLCNSSIARMTSVNHILGCKHRLKYIKLKDETTYKDIMSQKLQTKEKEECIAKAVAALEKKYGRGKVIAEIKDVKKPPEIPFEDSLGEDIEAGSSFLSSDSSLLLPEIRTTFESCLSESENSLSLTSELNESKEASLQSENKGSFGSLSPLIDEHTNVSVTSNSSMKRSSSFDEKSSKFLKHSDKGETKNQTLEIKSEFKEDDNVAEVKTEKLLDDKVLKSENEESMLETSNISNECFEKNQFESLLNILSQHDISSEEEADMFLQAIDILVKSLLCFKLKNSNFTDVEQLMTSLSQGSSDALEKILSHLRSQQDQSNVNSCTLVGSEIGLPSEKILLENGTVDVKESNMELLDVKKSKNEENKQENPIDDLNNKSDDTNVTQEKSLELTCDVVTSTEESKSNTSVTAASTPQPTTKNLLPPPFFGLANSNQISSNVQSMPLTSTAPSYAWNPQHYYMQMANMSYYHQHNQGAGAMPMYPNMSSYPQYNIAGSPCNSAMNLGIPHVSNLATNSMISPPPPHVPNNPPLPPPPPNVYGFTGSSGQSLNTSVPPPPPPLPPMVAPPPPPPPN